MIEIVEQPVISATCCASNNKLCFSLQPFKTM